MYKTKLGISVGLMGALICFLGYFLGITSWAFLAIIAVVLWKEENEWLRRLTVKVAIISLFFLLISLFFTWMQKFFDIFNSMFDASIKWPVSLDFYIKSIANILEIFIFVFLGFKSLNQRHVKIKPVDKIINENM